jgi:REP element-mobilizing transposase RayT
MLRGVAKHRIFVDDQDRRRFLSLLDCALLHTETTCFAWSLMGNHVHLALQTGQVPLSIAMARLNTRYAMYFNSRHGRVGHLFQNRFKNRMAMDEADLIGLIRYVHGNPLKDRVVPSASALERYPWTGHGAVVRAHESERFHSVNETLALYDGDPRQAACRARRQMQDYEAKLDAVADGSAWSNEETSPDPVTAICARLGVDVTALQQGRRNASISAARAIIAHLGVRAGIPRRELADRIGVSKQALGNACVRGKALVESSAPDDIPWESPQGPEVVVRSHALDN